MRNVLIDSCGKTWHPDDWYRQTGAALPQPNGITDFAIKNLGCISVAIRHNLATVRIAPARTATPTVLTLLKLLEPYQLNRIGLTWYLGQWNHEIVPDCQRLAKRVLGLVSQHSTQAQQRFLAQERRIDSLPNQCALNRVIELWRHFGGAIDLHCYDEALHELLEGRFTVSVSEDETSRLLFSQVGRGYAMYRRDFAEKAVGNRVDNQPDAVYGRWVANGLREAAIRNEPMLNDIDARVLSPGSHEHRVYYTRLTLPVIGPDNRFQLLSATLLDSDIDLRVDLLHQESENVID